MDSGGFMTSGTCFSEYQSFGVKSGLCSAMNQFFKRGEQPMILSHLQSDYSLTSRRYE